MAMESQKRRYIEDDCSSATVNGKDKRIKLVVEESEAKTNILTLNDDCFEKLFTFLQMKELGNIVMSNTRFSISATYIFKRFHANTLIVFDPFASNRRVYDHFINLLEGFGDSIQKLSVSFYHQQRYTKRNQRMLDLIIKKCSKNVVELSLYNIQRDMIISKPFPHLRKLAINDSYFNESMSYSIEKSPNIESLEFYSVENVFNTTFFEQNIPSMEHFGNYNQVITDSEIENLQKFRHFVNANPQLSSLGIGAKELEMMFRYEEVRRQFFKIIHRKLPFPEQKNQINCLFPFEPIYYGDLKKMDIALGYSTELFSLMEKRRLDIFPLEELSIYVDSLHMGLSCMVLYCRHLKKLRLNVCERLYTSQTYIKLIEVVINLPELAEFELIMLYDEQPRRSSVPFVIKTLIESSKTHCKFLKKIVAGFQTKGSSQSIEYQEKLEKFRDLFDENLPKDWHINFEGKNLEIKRQFAKEPFFLCAILEHDSI